MDATRVQHAPNDPADWTKAYADVAAKLDELADRIAAIDMNLAANSYITTDANSDVAAMTPGSDRFIITDNTGAPNKFGNVGGNRVVVFSQTSSPNSIPLVAQQIMGFKSGGGELIAHTFADDTFLGKLSGSDWDNLTAANARTILDIGGVSKAADQTKTNDTTLADDLHLTLPIVANTVYKFTACIRVKSHTTPDFKWGFTRPTGTTNTFGVVWRVSQGGGQSAADMYRGGTRPQTIYSTALDHLLLIIGQLNVGSTAGNLIFQWSQNTSDGNATTVHINSMMHLETFE